MNNPLSTRFGRFALVGIAGFLVDTGALYLALNTLGLGLYVGRVFSYLAAATSTWALNRRFTFHEMRSRHRIAEWGRFISANAVGGCVNYGCYALLIATLEPVRKWPVLGVAAGSIAGLVINFSLSRRVVFTGDRAKP